MCKNKISLKKKKKKSHRVNLIPEMSARQGSNHLQLLILFNNYASGVIK